MPKIPINFQNGVIYKIVCKDVGVTDCYVGSTTNIANRKRQHKSICYNDKKNGYHTYVYQFIRENGGWDNWDLILVEKYPCDNALELQKRERFYIEELKATLNKVIPRRSKNEVLEMKKKWREYNREKLLNEKKIYYQNNRDKFLKRGKITRENNRDKLKEINKKYRCNHKDEIKEQKGRKIRCACGCEITFGSIQKHKKTLRHNKLIALLSPPC